jgi:hypothetical protein
MIAYNTVPTAVVHIDRSGIIVYHRRVRSINAVEFDGPRGKERTDEKLKTPECNLGDRPSTTNLAPKCQTVQKRVQSRLFRGDLPQSLDSNSRRIPLSPCIISHHWPRKRRLPRSLGVNCPTGARVLGRLRGLQTVITWFGVVIGWRDLRSSIEWLMFDCGGHVWLTMGFTATSHPENDHRNRVRTVIVGVYWDSGGTCVCLMTICLFSEPKTSDRVDVIPRTHS